MKGETFFFCSCKACAYCSSALPRLKQIVQSRHINNLGHLTILNIVHKWWLAAGKCMSERAVSLRCSSFLRKAGLCAAHCRGQRSALCAQWAFMVAATESWVQNTVSKARQRVPCLSVTTCRQTQCLAPWGSLRQAAGVCYPP